MQASFILQHKKFLIGCVLILAFLSFVAYSFIAPQGMFSGLSKDLKVIDPEASVPYTDLAGTPVSLTQFKGKPLVINSWATWMPFSAAELKMLATLKQEYSDTVSILAINRKEETSTIRAYMEAYNLDETILLLTDQSDHFYTAVGGYAMPETLFYTADGGLFAHTRGVLTEEELRATLLELLSQD